MPRRSRWCASRTTLGIDIPTDGEIRRENYIHYHCRHLAGIDFETLTEKQMRGHYQALLPTITGPIQAARQPFLVRDWQIAQSATRKPVKITVPGPLTIGDSVADDFYRDRAAARRRARRCAQRRDPPPRGGRLPGDPGRRAGVRAPGRGRAGLRPRASRALLPQGAARHAARRPRLLRLPRQARRRGLSEGAERGLFRARGRPRRGRGRRGLDRGRAPAERPRPARALRPPR